MKRRIAVGISVLVALAACEDTDRPPRGDPNLIGGSANSTDTIEAALIRNQRALVRALAEDDTTPVGQLLSTRFVARDFRPGGHIADPEGVPGREIGYFEVLAGALQERMDSVYSMYHVTHGDERATVVASGVDGAIHATWNHGANGWAATRFIIVSADDGRRMIERSRQR